MVRRRGRCPRGRRLVAPVPWGHWKTTTFTAGLRRTGLVAPFLLDGPMDGEAFLVYIAQVLVPVLGQGDIVIMDNLPPYSPDLNPIELAFSKLKALLRKAAERTVPGLWHRIGLLLAEFTPQECAEFFRHDGYAAT
jgi:transposase